MINFFKKLFSNKSLDKDILLKFELDDGKMYEEKIKFDNFEERVSELQKQFHQPKALSEISFIYCLVGNIVEERFDKNLNKAVLGTKHFSPGTKVYCYPPMWGDGYENIKVIGRHRKSTRLITMVIPSDRVTNWRLKTVYNPFVIKEMTNNFGWTDKESDKERINEMLQWLAKR
ncbi:MULTISPECIES: hypothetical protein [unclassified Spirosoma]|nr:MULTISPECIES: hypothetical protein [unclassified Spirosoma]